jgi:protein-disulfide isomerase
VEGIFSADIAGAAVGYSLEMTCISKFKQCGGSMENVMVKIILAASFASIGTASAVYAEELAKGEAYIIAGPTDAKITIEEFSDFGCTYCAKGSATIKEILKDYSGKVKLVFRNFPLPFHQPGAGVAARAFAAVRLQNPALAYSFQTELFQNQDRLLKEGESFLYEAAGRLGVNVAQMKADMAGPVVAMSLAEDKQLAEEHKFNGTPSFVIGAESIVGAVPYEEFKKVLDRQLSK